MSFRDGPLCNMQWKGSLKTLRRMCAFCFFWEALAWQARGELNPGCEPEVRGAVAWGWGRLLLHPLLRWWRPHSHLEVWIWGKLFLAATTSGFQECSRLVWV